MLPPSLTKRGSTTTTLAGCLSLLFLPRGLRAMSTASAGTSSASAAIIFLHGLGDNSLGWSSLEQTLPRFEPRLQQCKFIFPDAPTIPISINGGFKMPGWFDLFDWPIAVGCQDDADGLYRSARQIESVIQQVQTRYPDIPRHRIVVGGFSQGAAVALLAAYHASDELPAREPLAGCAVLSGWWTLDHAKDSKSRPTGSTIINPTTPLFWAHGTYDDKVLFEQQAHGVSRLQDGGIKEIITKQYPMGHESYPDEIQALAKFLDHVLFDKETSESYQINTKSSTKEEL